MHYAWLQVHLDIDLKTGNVTKITHLIMSRIVTLSFR